VHVPVEDKSDDIGEQFYEPSERVFELLTNYELKIRSEI
jgi:hypothetical protein